MMDAFLKRGKISRSDNSSTEKSRPEKTSEPPAKKLKREEGSENAGARSPDAHSLKRAHDTGKDDVADGERSDNEPPVFRVPAIETALPEVKLDEQAIEEYEVFKSSQGDQDQDSPAGDSAEARLSSRGWIKGRTSIYVDAFNLALHTVLEEEAHLFDEKERAVFDQWNTLDYEAQFLYVPNRRFGHVC